jgi:cytosine/creatinine deaminase
MIDLLLKNGILSDGSSPVGLAIDKGVIVNKGQHIDLDQQARQVIDLQGRLVIPTFVESHVHLDIALMNAWDRPGRPASFHSPVELNQAMEQRRKDFTQQDIEERASMALEMAFRHGITFLRAQCHVDRSVGLKHLEALLKVRQKYSGRVDIQIVAFPQQGLLDQPQTLDLFREAFKMGADVMGGGSNLDPAAATMEGVQKHIDAALALAMEMDVDLDIHADLGLPERVELKDLEVVYIAQRTKEVGYQNRVTVGHVCALDSAEPDVAERAIAWIHEAQLNVISQPDMYRLGRQDRRCVRRGLTRVKQMLNAGINVAFASNNVRDAYRPLGNLDLLEEGLILAYGAHMDTVKELETLMRMCTENAARVLHLNKYGLNVGDTADMVILDAVSPSAALVGQAEKLYVIKNGQLAAANWCKSETYKVN